MPCLYMGTQQGKTCGDVYEGGCMMRVAKNWTGVCSGTSILCCSSAQAPAPLCGADFRGRVQSDLIAI